MKSVNLFVLLAFVLLSCQPTKKEATKFNLTNKSSVDLTDKALSIQRSDLSDAPENKFPVLLTSEGDTLASQFSDTNGDQLWDEIFFVANLSANASKEIKVVWTDTEIEYTKRTSVRFGKRDGKDLPVYPKTSDTLYSDEIHAKLGYQPYQTDGPSFENDKVGFRHYFDGRNAKDLFGKKTSAMSPESVGVSAKGGVEDNYHVMADWGRDVLAVGNSAGIGGIEIMIGESIVRLGCISGDTITNIENSVFEILEEGPVRSAMKFEYNNWQPQEDRNYQITENVKIWPGMYGYENNVTATNLQGDETLLVGIVNSNTETALVEIAANDKYVILYTHDQQTYDKTWWLGLALILPKDAFLGYGEAPKTGSFSTSYYGKLRMEDNTPLSYYAIGCWELSDERFIQKDFFEGYVKNLADQLAAEVQVERVLGMENLSKIE